MSGFAIGVFPATRRAPTPLWAAAATATHQPRAKRASCFLVASSKARSPCVGNFENQSEGQGGR